MRCGGWQMQPTTTQHDDPGPTVGTASISFERSYKNWESELLTLEMPRASHYATKNHRASIRQITHHISTP